MQHITIFKQNGQYAFTFANNYGKSGSSQPITLPIEHISAVEQLENYVDGLKTPEETIFDYFVQNAPDEEKLTLISFYPQFLFNKLYLVGDEFQYQDQLYRVVQEHTSQADWLPHLVPALYLKIEPAGVIPQWVQPTGEHDAYNTGDHVIFEDQEYVSLIDANTWSPTDYPAGWELVVS